MTKIRVWHVEFPARFAFLWRAVFAALNVFRLANMHNPFARWLVGLAQDRGGTVYCTWRDAGEP